MCVEPHSLNGSLLVLVLMKAKLLKMGFSCDLSTVAANKPSFEEEMAKARRAVGS